MRNPLTNARLHERQDSEIKRWKAEAFGYGSPHNLLKARLHQYLHRTHGRMPRAVIVGEVFFHEVQLELMKDNPVDMPLFWMPLFWMPEDERKQKLRDCPVPYDDSVGVLCWRSLWIVGNYSQQDAFVFIQ
jgi:hypothetical protein